MNPAKAGRMSELQELCSELEIDAIEALVIQAERLVKGQRKYGPLDAASDQRDWKKEREEEFRDALNYFAFEELRDRRRAAASAEPSQPTLPGVHVRPACVHKWRTEGVCDRCGDDEKRPRKSPR